MIYSEYVNRETKGYTDVLDIIKDVERIITRSGITNGIVTLSVTSSTSVVTAVEFEPGLVADFRKTLEVIASVKGVYNHNEEWCDGNGFAHILSPLNVHKPYQLYLNR
ncbi:MAG: YjbQ family protein [Endomicrobium sp.]|jgi:thiamine phosphate synthase YjbQ (UPF0047 family)|nr:YjbQ family protein [Endomicrobium sp.]